jgi:hypothetical protein
MQVVVEVEGGGGTITVVEKPDSGGAGSNVALRQQ